METKGFLNRILNPKSDISVKSFSLYLTSILGFVLGLMLGISLILDAKDGKIDTDLYGASAFVVAIGALVSLSAMPKTIVDHTMAKQAKDMENIENKDGE